LEGPTGPTGPGGGGDSLLRLIDSGSVEIADVSSVILGPFTRAANERIGVFIYAPDMHEGEHWGGEAVASQGNMEIAWRFLRNEIADPATQFNVQITHDSGSESPRTVEWAVYGFSV